MKTLQSTVTFEVFRIKENQVHKTLSRDTWS